jgi:hypothetical protein
MPVLAPHQLAAMVSLPALSISMSPITNAAL